MNNRFMDSVYEEQEKAIEDLKNYILEIVEKYNEALVELARVQSKYIVHLEEENDDLKDFVEECTVFVDEDGE